MNKLIASDLYKSYQSGGHYSDVLSGVSITISEGQAIGVIGSSGSGKTTLLQILAGLEHPDLGNIFFNEIKILLKILKLLGINGVGGRWFSLFLVYLSWDYSALES